MLKEGTRILKANSAPDDRHPDGSKGKITVVLPIPEDRREELLDVLKKEKDRVVPLPDGYLPEAFYMVEFDDMPGIPVGVADYRLTEDLAWDGDEEKEREFDPALMAKVILATEREASVEERLEEVIHLIRHLNPIESMPYLRASADSLRSYETAKGRSLDLVAKELRRIKDEAGKVLTDKEREGLDLKAQLMVGLDHLKDYLKGTTGEGK